MWHGSFEIIGQKKLQEIYQLIKIVTIVVVASNVFFFLFCNSEFS